MSYTFKEFKEFKEFNKLSMININLIKKIVYNYRDSKIHILCINNDIVLTNVEVKNEKLQTFRVQQGSVKLENGYILNEKSQYGSSDMYYIYSNIRFLNCYTNDLDYNHYNHYNRPNKPINKLTTKLEQLDINN